MQRLLASFDLCAGKVSSILPIHLGETTNLLFSVSLPRGHTGRIAKQPTCRSDKTKLKKLRGCPQHKIFAGDDSCEIPVSAADH